MLSKTCWLFFFRMSWTYSWNQHVRNKNNNNVSVYIRVENDGFCKCTSKAFECAWLETSIPLFFQVLEIEQHWPEIKHLLLRMRLIQLRRCGPKQTAYTQSISSFHPNLASRHLKVNKMVYIKYIVFPFYCYILLLLPYFRIQLRPWVTYGRVGGAFLSLFSSAARSSWTALSLSLAPPSAQVE